MTRRKTNSPSRLLQDLYVLSAFCALDETHDLQISIHSSPRSNGDPLHFSRPASPAEDVPPILPSAPPSHRRSQPPVGERWVEVQTHPSAQSQLDLDVPADDYDHHWNEWIHDVWNEDDGACLHYVPQTEGAGPSRLPAAQDKPPSQPRSRLTTIVENAVAGPSAGTDVNEPAPSQQPPKKRAKRKKVAGEESDAEGKAGDISQDELNDKMKEAILKDEALHLRILRYEVRLLCPVYFLRAHKRTERCTAHPF